MQEVDAVNALRALLGRLRIIGAWVFLLISWILFLAASRSALFSMSSGGIDWAILLDAGFGMYGLLGFGMASVAMLLASNAIDRSKSWFKPFVITQIISIAFLAPVFAAMVVFLFETF